MVASPRFSILSTMFRVQSDVIVLCIKRLVDAFKHTICVANHFGFGAYFIFLHHSGGRSIFWKTT